MSSYQFLQAGGVAQDLIESMPFEILKGIADHTFVQGGDIINDGSFTPIGNSIQSLQVGIEVGFHLCKRLAIDEHLWWHKVVDGDQTYVYLFIASDDGSLTKMLKETKKAMLQKQIDAL